MTRKRLLERNAILYEMKQNPAYKLRLILFGKSYVTVEEETTRCFLCVYKNSFLLSLKKEDL